MILNGSGIRAYFPRSWGLHRNRDNRNQKKSSLQSINTAVLDREGSPSRAVEIIKVEEVEADEMWSFVSNKQNQRWIGHAIDHETGEVLAYVIGQHQDSVLVKLKALLEPFGVIPNPTDLTGAIPAADSKCVVAHRANILDIIPLHS